MTVQNRRSRIALALAVAVLLHVGLAALVVLLPRQAIERPPAVPRVSVELRTVAPGTAARATAGLAEHAPAQGAVPPAPAASGGALEHRSNSGSAAAGKGALEQRSNAGGTPSSSTRPARSARAGGAAPAAPAQAPARDAPPPAAAWSQPWVAREGLQGAPGAAAGGGSAQAAAPPGGGTADAAAGAAKQGWGPGWGLSTQLRNPGASLGGKGPPADELPGPERVPSRAEALAEEQARVQGRVEGWVTEDAARIRVRDAREGYWQDLQDKLEKDFKVEWDVLDKGRRGPGGVGRLVGEAASSWQRAAAAYGRGGNPLAGADGTAEPRPLNQEVQQLPPSERGYRDDPALGTSLAPMIALGGGGGGAADGPFHHRLVVYVMVTQGDDGHIEEVTLRGSSGNGLYDGLALDRARGLSKDGSLGAPPRGHKRSLWAFETDFTQMPPFPIAGCAIDALFVPRECYYPLKKTVKTRLRLEAVY